MDERTPPVPDLSFYYPGRQHVLARAARYDRPDPKRAIDVKSLLALRDAQSNGNSTRRYMGRHMCRAWVAKSRFWGMLLVDLLAVTHSLSSRDSFWVRTTALRQLRPFHNRSLRERTRAKRRCPLYLGKPTSRATSGGPTVMSATKRPASTHTSSCGPASGNLRQRPRQISSVDGLRHELGHRCALHGGPGR